MCEKPYYRWTATVWYRTEAGGGLVDVVHVFEELEELHDLIEQGPSFYAIERIEIRITEPDDTTIEGALRE